MEQFKIMQPFEPNRPPLLRLGDELSKLVPETIDAISDPVQRDLFAESMAIPARSRKSR